MADTDPTPWRTDSILPSPPAGAVPVLHDREYRVESFLLDNGNLLIQGAVRDQKPPGVYIPDDPEPLTCTICGSRSRSSSRAGSS